MNKHCKVKMKDGEFINLNHEKGLMVKCKDSLLFIEDDKGNVVSGFNLSEIVYFSLFNTTTSQ